MRTFFNFRDLGNLPTMDGRKVPTGVFFRSGNWDTATKEELEFLKSLKIKNVYDYRDVAETKKDHSNYEFAGVIYNNYPTAVRNDKLLKLQKSSFFKKLKSTVSYEDVAITYANLPFDNPGYQAVINAVKNHETPILQHCFAGKDRAGVGVALVLSLLGVSREVIMEDYMASVEFYDEFVYYAMRKLPRFIRKKVVKRAESLFTVHPILLNATFDAIDKKYGDMDTFFEKEHGLTKEDIKNIRDHYLV